MSNTGDSQSSTDLPVDTGQNLFRAVDGSIKTSQEPFKPGGDVQAAFLGSFQNIVVGGRSGRICADIL